MATEIVKQTIGNCEYSVQQWPPSTALPMKFRLIGIFGKSIPNIIAVAQEKDDAKQAEVLFEEISGIIEKTGPEQLAQLVKEVVCSANRSVMGGEFERLNATKFEEIYGNNFMEMYQVFAFVIKANYGDFFNGLDLKNL